MSQKALKKESETENEVLKITTKARFLCNICDCVSIGKRGDDRTLEVFRQFPYANTYASRLSTKKAVPGTFEVKGDGQKKRYVVNLFVQFYPGSSKYPNDNITRRLSWFSNCLDKMLSIPSLGSLAFPEDLGISSYIDNSMRYLHAINDFTKKYYLRHKQTIVVYDYNHQKIDFKQRQTRKTKYEEPIEVLYTDYVDPNELNSEPKINVIHKIKIDQLRYSPSESDAKSIMETKQPKMKNLLADVGEKPKQPKMQNLLTDIEESDSSDTKPLVKKKIAIKKTKTNEGNMSSRACDSGDTPRWDKNPSWTQKVSELPIDESWDPVFKDPIMINQFRVVDQKFDEELKVFGDHIEILPRPQRAIFNAFNLCKFPPKAVIIGQDPYFSNLDEAMGLSFSVPPGVTVPPSLVNIYKELKNDIPGFEIPKSGDLTKWAEQGVLLLNSALTVRYKQKTKHMKIWKDFVNNIIKLMTKRSPDSIVFMLWGGFAKDKEKLIENPNRHVVLKATHPSPLGANKGGWFGCKHFSQANEALQKSGRLPIDWKLV